MSNHDNHRIPETELLDCYRVDCWEISHLLNDSLPSNLDVRQSSKSLTKQAPCARQGVRGHWPISVDQKIAPSPKNPKSDERIRVGETQQVWKQTHLPDTSRASSNHCGTLHDPFVSLWAIRASVSFPCPVVILFWRLGTPSHGGFHSTPEAAWIHIGTMFLSEWMDGEQQNWRISVKCIDAFVAYKWILTSGAGHIHV